MYNSRSFRGSIRDFLNYVDPRNMVARCGEAHFYLTQEGYLRFLTDGIQLVADKKK